MPTVNAVSTTPRTATAVDRPVASDELDSLSTEEQRAAELQGFEGKAGQTLALASGAEGPIVVLVGLGARSDVSTSTLRDAAASFVRAVAKHKVVATNLTAELDESARGDAIAAVVEGVRLASYRYTRFKSNSEPALDRVSLVVKGRGVKAEVEKQYAAWKEAKG